MTFVDKFQPIIYPVRQPTNLFSVDITSILLKDRRQQLDIPFFALSKKPDLEPRRYEDGHGDMLEITPSVKGLPTIYDQDFLIYAISQVTACLNRGEAPHRHLILYGGDMLEFANRTRSGKGYNSLEDAFARLSGCSIRIRNGSDCNTETLDLIESARPVRRYHDGGRLQHIEVTLPEWLWNAIEARQVLTLHPDYFRLRRPLERRIYEIARKHCGQQAKWRISLELLHICTGSKSRPPEFRRMLRELVARDDLLDYAVSFDAGRDMVTFRRRARPPPAPAAISVTS